MIQVTPLMVACVVIVSLFAAVILWMMVWCYFEALGRREAEVEAEEVEQPWGGGWELPWAYRVGVVAPCRAASGELLCESGTEVTVSRALTEQTPLDVWLPVLLGDLTRQLSLLTPTHGLLCLHEARWDVVAMHFGDPAEDEDYWEEEGRNVVGDL